METSVRRLIIGFITTFLLMEIWMGYWVVWKGPALVTNSRNPRIAMAEGRLPRGGIYDTNGKPMVISVWQNNAYKREFQAPLSVVQTIGYMHSRYGKSGLERSYDAVLRSSTASYPNPFIPLHQRSEGADIVTTIDSELQLAAEKAMNGQRGAVVVIDAQTGAILTAVSVPYFDPAAMDDNLINDDKGQALFNRALQGRYAPGSAWKPVVLTAALETRAVSPDDYFVDNGSITVGNHVVHNYEGEVLGNLSLKDALVRSSNVAFVQIGMKTSGEAIHNLTRRLGILDEPDLHTPATASHLPSLAEYRQQEVRAQTGFGQGGLWVTPLHMAVVAATIGNGGYAVTPYLVQQLGEKNVAPTSERKRVMPEWVAKYVSTAMRAVVTSGTGRRAAVSGITVAGKTGTADNPGGKAHAWFIAFAPADKPRIALAVVLENSGGTGGGKAAPIAAKVIQAALK